MCRQSSIWRTWCRQRSDSRNALADVSLVRWNTEQVLCPSGQCEIDTLPQTTHTLSLADARNHIHFWIFCDCWVQHCLKRPVSMKSVSQSSSFSDINYFHCLRIVEILKDTESGTKNIFGRYSSTRMKVRTDLCRSTPSPKLAGSVN